jgi:hypothetical protein
MPGIKVRPWPLMSSWWTVRFGLLDSDPIQLMALPVTSTLTSEIALAPVPSMSLTFLITRSMVTSLNRFFTAEGAEDAEKNKVKFCVLSALCGDFG